MNPGYRMKARWTDFGRMLRPKTRLEALSYIITYLVPFLILNVTTYTNHCSLKLT